MCRLNIQSIQANEVPCLSLDQDTDYQLIQSTTIYTIIHVFAQFPINLNKLTKVSHYVSLF
jgi:hypothetical protein